MMRVTELSKDLAERAWGTSWYVDAANGMLREWLGHTRPVFQFGESFANLSDAKAAGYGHLELRSAEHVTASDTVTDLESQFPQGN